MTTQTKTILLTGSTDGIGLETARMLAASGHHLLLHGRNADKLDRVVDEVSGIASAGPVERYVADLSTMADVDAMAQAIADAHSHLDVLINNAGVFNTSTPITPEGLDVRFVVNTLAPYRLTQRLLPLMNASGRVVNLSSAAQSPVSIDAMLGSTRLSDFEAYAQSKLAITMWSRTLAKSLGEAGPVVVSVNPASMLGTKMVKDAFGVSGNDISIGADILVRAATSDEFADASGKYYDNDARRFGPPHAHALDDQRCAPVLEAIETLLARS
ncbi:MAG: SDR family NAD(P)-dependent oxidoreductase [Myxococcota bacterium]